VRNVVERELTDHVAHGGLAYLIGRLIDILDGDDRLLRIRHVVVGDRGDIYGDVVLGDDFLRRYLHRDGAQRDALHALDGDEDEIETRITDAREFAEEKYHAAFVLAQNAYGTEEVDDDSEQKSVCPFHVHTIFFVSPHASDTPPFKKVAPHRLWRHFNVPPPPLRRLPFAGTCLLDEDRRRLDAHESVEHVRVETEGRARHIREPFAVAHKYPEALDDDD